MISEQIIEQITELMISAFDYYKILKRKGTVNKIPASETSYMRLQLPRQCGHSEAIRKFTKYCYRNGISAKFMDNVELIKYLQYEKTTLDQTLSGYDIIVVDIFSSIEREDILIKDGHKYTITSVYEILKKTRQFEGFLIGVE